jgi:hypothetical protein
MVLLLGAIACWVFMQMDNQKSKIKNQKSKKNLIVFCIFVAYIFTSQYFIGATFRHYMGAIFAPMYLIFILIFSEHTSEIFLKKLGEKFIRYSLIILCIEAVLRYSISLYGIILNPDNYYDFYAFKHNGPMYRLSNAVACHLVTLLFFILWWGKTYKKSMKKEFFIILVLIALTFSRASIPAVILGFFYYHFFKNLNWKKSLLVLLTKGIIGVFALLILRYFINDYSFQSKFLIFDEAWIYYQTASWKNILFGIGFYETGNIMTYYAHNYFLLFLMETGIIGLILLCTTLFILIKTTNGAAMIVLVPFIIQTSTESNTFLPYFYVVMALIVTLGNGKTLNKVNHQN